MSEQLEAAQEKILDRADSIAERAQDNLEVIRDRAQDTWAGAMSYTKENPATALGIAIGAGALLGYLLHLFSENAERS